MDPEAVRVRDPVVWIVRPSSRSRDACDRRARYPTDPGRSVDPTVKNFHWGDLVRGLFEAYDRDAWLAILLDADGLVCEGAGLQRVRRSWTASC